jgi:hypothetical protein
VFEDRWWDDGSPDPVELGPGPWEIDYDTPVEELAAADPDRPRSVAERLDDLEHGPVFSELAGFDLDAASDDERVAVAVAAQRWVNHFEAVKLAAVAAYAGREPRTDTCDEAFAWTEVAGALRVGEGTARATVANARRLVSHLPATLAAMRTGDVSFVKARTLIDATAAMDRGQCAEVEARVLAKAAGRSPSEHAKAVGRAVRAVDPDGWARNRDGKLKDVALIRFNYGDGVADILARAVEAFDAETIWTGADTWARAAKAAGDERTLDALRVAALVHWAGAYLTGTPTTAQEPAAPPVAPTRNGQPATVNIVIGLPDVADPARGGAATIAGSGEPLPAEAVAELLRHGARIRFALVDTEGRLAGISTDRHDPTVLQRVFIALRDVTIRVPGGSVTPVAGQDLDHLDPHGPTEPDNLHPPSRGWHRAKTFGHWTVTANPDGTITWTSRRTGRTYTTHPYNHHDP